MIFGITTLTILIYSHMYYLCTHKCTCLYFIFLTDVVVDGLVIPEEKRKRTSLLVSTCSFIVIIMYILYLVIFNFNSGMDGIYDLCE